MTVAARIVLTQYNPTYPPSPAVVVQNGQYRVTITQIVTDLEFHYEIVQIERFGDSGWRPVAKKTYDAYALPLPRAYTIYRTGFLFVVEQSVLGYPLDVLAGYGGATPETDFSVTAPSSAIVSMLDTQADIVGYSTDGNALRQITTGEVDFQTQAREFYGVEDFVAPDTAATTLQECLWDIDTPIQGTRVVFFDGNSEIILSTNDIPTRVVAVDLDYQSDFLEGRFPCNLATISIDAGLDEWATDEEIAAALTPFAQMKWCAVYHSIYDANETPYHLWLGTYRVSKARYDRGASALVVECQYLPLPTNETYLTHAVNKNRVDALVSAAVIETDQDAGDMLVFSPRVRALPLGSSGDGFNERLRDQTVLGKLVMTPIEWKQQTTIPFVGSVDGTIVETTATYRFPSTTYAAGDYALVAFDISTGQNNPVSPTADGWALLARHNLDVTRFVAILGKTLTAQDLDTNIDFMLPTIDCVIHQIATAYRGAAPVTLGGSVEPALTTRGFAVVLAATPPATEHEAPVTVPDSDAPSIQGTPGISPTRFSVYHRAYAGSTGLTVPSKTLLEWVSGEDGLYQLTPSAVVIATWAIPFAMAAPQSVFKREWLLCSADDLTALPPVYLPRGAVIDTLPDPEQTNHDFDITGYGLQPQDLNAALASTVPYRVTINTVASPLLLPGRPVLLDVNGYYWSGQILRSKYKVGAERRQELELALYEDTGQPVLDLAQPTGTALYTSTGDMVYISAAWNAIEIPAWLESKVIGWRLAFYRDGMLVTPIDILSPDTLSHSCGPFPMEMLDYDLAVTLCFSNNATSPTGILTKTTSNTIALMPVAGDQFAASGQTPLWYIY